VPSIGPFEMHQTNSHTHSWDAGGLMIAYNIALLIFFRARRAEHEVIVQPPPPEPEQRKEEQSSLLPNGGQAALDAV